MTSAAADVSNAIQDYAKAIYSLEGRLGEPVSTSAIADRLDVSAASASAMVKRLSEQDLVAHVPYKGVELTPRGREVALEVLRHHRLIELYLATYLDVPWDRVHDEAEALEHVISEDLEARIAAKLHDPPYDPHGDPIPTSDLAVEDRKTRSLDGCSPGTVGRFVRVSDSDPDMLRYLEGLGIGIGDGFEVVDRQPFDGPLTVRFGDREHALGCGLAGAMRVEVDR